MACLPHWCCWTVLPDGVIQHNFSQNLCNFACLCAWESEEIFPEGPLVDFSKRFSRGGKSGEIWFLTLETKATAIFAAIFKFLPLFRHPCLCVGKVRATPLKNWCNFKRFNTILNSVICWILYAKWNIRQINSNCAFVFALEKPNSYILFLHWQHNWHPYGQLASCHVCFLLSLYSGI